MRSRPGATARAVTLLAAGLLLPAAAAAHPMGNVSISHYAGIELSPDSVLVKYLLDFAEVPSVRELDRVDPDGDERVTPEEREAYLAARTGETLARLDLEVNGRRVPLAAAWSRVTFPPGEGGLSTVRIAWELHGAWPEPLGDANFLKWADGNYETAPGWKEIRFAASGGLGVGATSLRTAVTSDGLAEYPKEFLSNPPTDTKAWCQFGPGMTAENAPPATDVPEGFGRHEGSRFTDLVTNTSGGAGPFAAALLLAMLLGAGHALEPGHGKSIVAAYLVGTRGTVAQAALLGLVVTFTHTFSVFLLGFGVLLLSHYFLPERILPWLGFVSGLLVAIVGVTLLRARWREWSAARAHVRAHAQGIPHTHDRDHGHGHDHDRDHAHEHEHDYDPAHDDAHAHDHDHAHDHSHAHGHAHSHGPWSRPHTHHVPERATLGSILALGISGGLVPCPAGIVVLLSAISLGRAAFGLLLILAFSVGLAAVLMGIAILFVTARRAFDRLPLDAGHLRLVAVLSATFVTVFGVALAVRSLLGGHLFPA